eukprot:291171_1
MSAYDGQALHNLTITDEKMDGFISNILDELIPDNHHTVDSSITIDLLNTTNYQSIESMNITVTYDIGISEIINAIRSEYGTEHLILEFKQCKLTKNNQLNFYGVKNGDTLNWFWSKNHNKKKKLKIVIKGLDTYSSFSSPCRRHTTVKTIKERIKMYHKMFGTGRIGIKHQRTGNTLSNRCDMISCGINSGDILQWFWIAPNHVKSIILKPYNNVSLNLYLGPFATMRHLQEAMKRFGKAPPEHTYYFMHNGTRLADKIGLFNVLNGDTILCLFTGEMSPH